jgi:CRP-like cAMP-binding protein
LRCASIEAGASRNDSRFEVEPFSSIPYKDVVDQSRRFIAPGQNRLLSGLPREVQLMLLPRMERVSLGIRHSLHQAGAPISHLWFPLSGVISLVITLKNGISVEVGTIGNEGVVGMPVFHGAERSATHAFCQVAGQAMKMRVETFKRAVEEHPELNEMVRRYAQAMTQQTMQSTACNHAHTVQQRMCRWLLMTHDRVGADEFHLTQEFLAQMLGVRRPSVTVVAGVLQKAGLISYRRGRIRIADRAGLEAGACECYDAVRTELDRLLATDVALAFGRGSSV